MDYEATNKARWNERAAAHAASPDYKFEQLIGDRGFISDVVKFDKPLLGDISGLNCVHLQCHIGTDTLSLARLGAASVTGLDYSGASLDEARKLAHATKGSGGEKLRFVEASVSDSLEVLPPKSFDLVFTGIGALCWIPSVKEWAKVVSGLLKPGGRLFIREFHPVLLSIDYENSDQLVLKYPYFERPEPTVSEEKDSYVATNGHEFATKAVALYNHGVGEVVQALLSQNMRLTRLIEHESVPWLALPDQMNGDGQGECSLKDRPWRLPHSYTIEAIKEDVANL